MKSDEKGYKHEIIVINSTSRFNFFNKEKVCSNSYSKNFKEPICDILFDRHNYAWILLNDMSLERFKFNPEDKRFPELPENYLYKGSFGVTKSKKNFY